MGTLVGHLAPSSFVIIVAIMYAFRWRHPHVRCLQWLTIGFKIAACIMQTIAELISPFCFEIANGRLTLLCNTHLTTAAVIAASGLVSSAIASTPQPSRSPRLPHTYTHMHTYTYIHTHTHTHTQTDRHFPTG